LTAETQPESGTTTYGYNSDGLLASKTDALDHTTTFGYDATTGDLLSVTDPLTHGTTFTYDSLGRRTTVTDALSHSTQFLYDALNRQTVVIDALSHRATHDRPATDGEITCRAVGSSVRRATMQHHGLFEAALSTRMTGLPCDRRPDSGHVRQQHHGKPDPQQPFLHLTSGPLDVTYSYDAAGNVIRDRRCPVEDYDSNSYYDALIGSRRWGAALARSAMTPRNHAQQSVGIAGSVSYSYSSDQPADGRISGSTERQLRYDDLNSA
jgi:YD repeat-containing protein